MSFNVRTLEASAKEEEDEDDEGAVVCAAGGGSEGTDVEEMVLVFGTGEAGDTNEGRTGDKGPELAGEEGRAGEEVEDEAEEEWDALLSFCKDEEEEGEEGSMGELIFESIAPAPGGMLFLLADFVVGVTGNPSEPDEDDDDDEDEDEDDGEEEEDGVAGPVVADPDVAEPSLTATLDMIATLARRCCCDGLVVVIGSGCKGSDGDAGGNGGSIA